MNAAGSAATQTITVAASQSARPLIERPLETRSVMIRERSVAISATPPSTPEPLRRSELTRKGCARARTTVKITTAMMKPAALIFTPSRTIAATSNPTAFGDQQHEPS